MGEDEIFNDGYLNACADIKDIVSQSHQRVSSHEAHKVLDEIWQRIKVLELIKKDREPLDIQPEPNKEV